MLCRVRSSAKFHRVNRELVEELEQVVGDGINDFNQEMSATHCWVEYSQVE